MTSLATSQELDFAATIDLGDGDSQGFENASAVAETIGLGFGEEVSSIDSVGTNLSDEAVNVLFGFVWETVAEFGFDEPEGEGGRTSFEIDLALPDADVVSLGRGAEFFTSQADCEAVSNGLVTDTECQQDDSASGTYDFDLAAGGTLAYSIAVTATASVSEVAPIPLPAAAPAAALALGALAWVGRRRSA